MKLLLQLLTLSVFVALAGCATRSKSVHDDASTPPPPNISKANRSTGGAAVPRGLPEGEYAILVESVPTGATVVVNGIPVGRAPQRVVLPGTRRGFFREQVSLKVRFIAADATQASKTVEELLTPLDRIPKTLRFTPSGASRVSR